MLKYAEDFKPINIELDKSVPNKLDSFLMALDTNSLRKQKTYELFIAVILSKLYYYHLKCCNQSYELLSMKKGAAGIIINEFEKMAGYQNQHLEMLSSSTIFDFVEKKRELSDNTFLKEILINIKNEEHRISKGIM